jgi:parvulin-like peptidyl-prolyl isomerase
MTSNGFARGTWNVPIFASCLLLVASLAVAQAPVTRPATKAAAGAPRTAGPGVAAPQGQARPAMQAAPRAGAPAAAAQGAGGPVAAKPNPTSLQVMAVVNGEQITKSELGRESIRRYGEEVLESLVSRQLLLAACKEKGIQITEQDVTDEVEKIATRFGLSRDRWMALLQEERGFTEVQYKREIVWPMLALRRLAADQIAVSQEELKKAFESEFGARVRCRVIAVSSKQKADQAFAEANANPATFGELSKKHSEEPALASAYGVIPPIRKNMGDPNLERAAFALKMGQISQPIQVANMYYVLKCEEHIQQQFIAGPQMAEQQKRLEERIRENKMRMAAAQMMEQMIKAASVENVFNDPEKAKAQPGVAAIVNGQPIALAILADECIARHGEDVLDGEINRKVLSQELAKKKVTITPQDIDAEIDRAADAYGFLQADGSPDKERWLKSITEQDGATVDLYVRDAVWPSVALKKLVGSRVTITEEDLSRGFEANYGERVEVQAIVMSDQRQAQKVWELAKNNNTEAFFADLAQQYSVEPASRGNGGRVPPIRKHGGSPLIEDAAFLTKPGDISGIVAVDSQYIILRVLGRTQPVQVEFEAVRKELEKDIQEKKLRALMTNEFDRLRTTAQIDNFLAGTTQSGKGLRPAGALTPLSPATGATPRPAQTGGIAPAAATRAVPKTR